MLRVETNGFHGIVLPDLRVALDVARSDLPFVFVSHAHADHMPRDRKLHIYCTAATADLLRIRGFKGQVNILDFEKNYALDGFSVTLFPAGHILGSAMIFIESKKGSLLYTGDFKTPPSAASEGFSHPKSCDILITEATFSLPIYRWKPRHELGNALRTFAQDALSENRTPIFLAYNLGKAQEIMHELVELEKTVQIHGAGYRLCRIYEKHGIDLGQYEPYKRQTLSGKILVTPSSSLEQPMIQNIPRKKVAYVSGWAALEARHQQMCIDKSIPLSDHADYFEVINFCQRLSPKHVFVTHSPQPEIICAALKDLGISASSLK